MKKQNIIIVALSLALLVTGIIAATNNMSFAATRNTTKDTEALNAEIKSLSRELAMTIDKLNSHDKVDIINPDDVDWTMEVNDDGTRNWTGTVLSWKLQADGLDNVDKVNVEYNQSMLERGLVPECAQGEGGYTVDDDEGTLTIKLVNVPSSIAEIDIDSITVYRITYE